MKYHPSSVAHIIIHSPLFTKRKDLFNIHDSAFRTEKTPTDIVRKDTGSNAPAHLSVGLFSVRTLKQLDRISDLNKNIIYTKSAPNNQWFWKEINEELIINPIRKQLEKIERAKRPISQSKLNITKAKEFPITSLLTFKYNKAICPFHPDRNPSLTYYPRTNTVYCFSCASFGDSIAVYMALNKVDFVTAVKSLQ